MNTEDSQAKYKFGEPEENVAIRYPDGSTQIVQRKPRMFGDDPPRPDIAWTTEWPTEPGWYWFFGFRFKSRDRPPELATVRVHKTMKGVARVGGASFMYRGEGDHGVWAKLDTPEPPSIPREE